MDVFMPECPSSDTAYQAIDLDTGEPAERPGRRSGPITIVHDAATPCYAVLWIELWEVLRKMPPLRAKAAEAGPSASSLPLATPIIGQSIRRLAVFGLCRTVCARTNNILIWISGDCACGV
jgi:hypothetical protein